MKRSKCHMLITDDDFKRLCPPTSKERYEDISILIRNFGCPRPIQVWNKIILTDFIYYEICQRYNIPFPIERMTFTSKDDAIYYVAKETLKSDNIPISYQRYIIGATYASVKEILRNVSKKTRTNPFPPHLMEYGNHIDNGNKSAIIVSNTFNVSSGSVLDYFRFFSAVNILYSKAPSVAKDIMKYTFPIGMKSVTTLSHMPIDKISEAYSLAKTSSDYSLIQDYEKESVPETTPVTFASKPRQYIQSSPEIKKMPKYDPDAELSSLSFTIPSWISSMNRTIAVANFSGASEVAKHRLSKALTEITNTIILLQDKLEENDIDG